MRNKTRRKYYVFKDNVKQRSFKYLKKAKQYALSLEGLVEIDVEVLYSKYNYLDNWNTSSYYPKVYTVVEDTKFTKKH